MILVTGATGFVGNAVVQRILADDAHTRVVVAVRKSNCDWPDRVLAREIGNIETQADLSAMLEGVTAVVHCAARVHVMTGSAAAHLAEFFRVNVQGTLSLAKKAAEIGVRRFVFISSIKVNGESTQQDSRFRADDVPAPEDAYGISKLAAEQGLRELAARTGMELVIIRPPLVYGPGVKANFASMIRWLNCGIPLPLGAIQNKRSFVALDNLVDLIFLCLTSPAAANQTFLVSDCEDVSTPDLLRRMGYVMGCPVRLMQVPPRWLRVAATLIGKKDVVQRLCGSLQVDMTKTRQILSWSPPVTLDEGLKKVVE